MSELLKLRDYQRACLDALVASANQRSAAVLPTGAGKTVVFAHRAAGHLAQHPNERVVILVHTNELADQACRKLHQVAPHLTIGVVKAERNEVGANVIVASVQSLRNDARIAKLRNVGLVIVDECHHATAPTYRRILEQLGCFTEGSNVRAEGFTATLVRGDKAKLSEVWQAVAYRRDIAFMIRRKYLLDVKGRRVEVPRFDISTVRKSGGDYAEGALGEALIESLAPEVVAKAYLEHASDRKGIGFAPTVESAYAFNEAFTELGITSEVIHGALHKDVRRAILLRLHTGETQFVWNCMVLTEGFDEPTVSCAVIARPTRSAGLYQQMVGRVLRPDLSLPEADRGYALVMDVVGISSIHADLRSLIDLSDKEIRQDEDGELSLLELEDLLLEQEAETELPGSLLPEEYYAGPVEVREFDPLGRDSARTWGKTPNGTYWMAAGTESYVFLGESLKGDPGTYDVVLCSKADSGPVRGTEHQGLTLEMALAWAEDVATEEGGHGTLTLTQKKAKWRKDPATSAQVYRATRMGIKSVERDGELVRVEDATKGEISTAIDSKIASNRIDPLIEKVRKFYQK